MKTPEEITASILHTGAVKLAKETIWDRIFNENNTAAGFLILGLIFLVAGSLFKAYLDNTLWGNAGELSFGIGSAILGAGVYAWIMKTSLFINVLKKHLHEVLYDPLANRSTHALIDTWTSLTEALLKGVLPTAHINAALSIKDRFLNSITDFHLESYTIAFDITVNPDKSLVVTETVSANIYPNANKSNPIYTLGTEVAGISHIVSLRLNGESNTSRDGIVHTSETINGVKISKLQLELNKYINDRTSDGIVRFECIQRYVQKNLYDEPYIVASIASYTKGYEVRAKINNGYKLFFEPFGMNSMREGVKEEKINDYSCWVIAKDDIVLIPGSGFVLMITDQET